MDTGYTDPVERPATFNLSVFHTKSERPLFHFVTLIDPSLSPEAIGSCFQQAIESCKDTDHTLQELTFVVTIR